MRSHSSSSLSLSVLTLPVLCGSSWFLGSGVRWVHRHEHKRKVNTGCCPRHSAEPAGCKSAGVVGGPPSSATGSCGHAGRLGSGVKSIVQSLRFHACRCCSEGQAGICKRAHPCKSTLILPTVLKIIVLLERRRLLLEILADYHAAGLGSTWCWHRRLRLAAPGFVLLVTSKSGPSGSQGTFCSLQTHARGA